MPSISITEKDTTSPGVVLTTEDVVLIPGFVNKKCLTSTAVEAYIPTLCSNVSTFESYFGSIPAQFKEDQEFPDGFSYYATSGLEDKMFEKNTMDPGYIFAKELLNVGIPVLYVRMNENDWDDDDTDVTVKHMYQVLAGETDYDLWSDVKDIGEYPEIKFITSGGYPTFEYDVIVISPLYSDVILNDNGFDQSKLLNQIPRRLTLERIAEFKYARLAKVVEELPTKPAAGEEGLIHVVKSTDEAYKWENEAWSAVSSSLVKIWEVSVDGEDFIQVNMSDYGFDIKRVEYGGSITVTIPPYANAVSYISDKMIDLASTRGDAVALIDHTDNPGRALNPTAVDSVYYAVAHSESSFVFSKNPEFGAMFTPWCTVSFATDLMNQYNNGTTGEKAVAPSYMPASFVYLMAYAESVQTNASWLAIAGAARGVAAIGQPHLASGIRLSNAIAEAYQPRYAEGEYLGVAINPITKIKPYGYLIWGNRTLKNNPENLTATSFLNTRNMVSDIKKLAYRSAKKCMFEQNSDILWLNFKSMITPTLDQMVTGNGLSGYKLIQEQTSEKAKLKCIIRIYPIYAVETFDITVELADDEVTIS